MELGLSVEQIAHFRGMVASHNSKILLSSSEAHTKALDVVDAIVANLGELCHTQAFGGNRAVIQWLMLLFIWIRLSLGSGILKGRRAMQGSPAGQPCFAGIWMAAVEARLGAELVGLVLCCHCAPVLTQHAGAQLPSTTLLCCRCPVTSAGGSAV